MRKSKVLTATGVLLLLAGFSVAVNAAPPCKGPNKNDPGCSAPVAATPVVTSASVDWVNQRITVRGSDLDLVTDFFLGGSTTLTTTDVTPDQVNLPFDTTLAGELTARGNYLLNIDGSDVLSIFVKSQVVDSTALGCPCEAGWISELGPLSLWGPPLDTQCLELAQNGGADIAGTVLTDPADPATYPHYPIGAAYIPGDPVSSVCRLVKVDALTTDLLNLRINANQQATCTAILKANICAPPP